MRGEQEYEKEKTDSEDYGLCDTVSRGSNMFSPFLLAGQKFLYENRTDFQNAAGMDSGSFYS